MDHAAIPQQVLVEHQTLAFIISALRATLGWKYQGADLTRKLESLRFVGHSFDRHLKRLMILEEKDGYMTVVLESRPELSDEIEILRSEHAEFDQGLCNILTRLECVDPTDHFTFLRISDDLAVLLQKLEEHSKKETDLLQEALLQDEGGEG